MRQRLELIVCVVCHTDEPFKEYEGFEIDIRMIRAVAVDVGSARKAVPDKEKTFSFVGDGTASEVYKKWRTCRCIGSYVVDDMQSSATGSVECGLTFAVKGAASHFLYCSSYVFLRFLPVYRLL